MPKLYPILIHCRNYTLSIAETIPHLKTLRKNPSITQNQILVGSQSESSKKNPKTSSANQNRVSQCRKKTQTLSARVVDPSRLLAPAEPSRLAVAYLITWRVYHPPSDQLTLLLLSTVMYTVGRQRHKSFFFSQNSAS